MASNDLRKNPRRVTERREEERRTISYPFGSPQWIEIIQQEYVLWPKKDRRLKDRRILPRRQNLRRIKQSTPSKHTQTTSLHNLLSKDEKQMLQELIQSDLND